MTIPIGKLDTLAAAKILVIGDAILDRYTFGVAERVSPEAPVLVLRADQREARPGGAASVASLLRGLGADVTLAGVVGDDADARRLRSLLQAAGVETEFLLADPNRPTTTKERFLGRAANRHPQQILRVDHEVREPIGPELVARLAMATSTRCQAVLVSDYAKGVCTPRLLKNVIAVARGQHVPVIVDPARTRDYELYRGARIVVPNRTDAELATGIPIHSSGDALRAAARLCNQHGFWAVLVKLDADGIAVVNPAAGLEQHVPTRRHLVYDVTGAGDMVLAIMGLCQAARWGLMETALLANTAAGLEVERFGVAPVSWDEIRAELEATATSTERFTCKKRPLSPQAVDRRSGCADHSGDSLTGPTKNRIAVE